MDHSIVTDDTPRERYLTVARLGDKISRKKSFIYSKLKNDPAFPRPLRLGAFPVFAESEIDAWVKNTARASEATPSVVSRLKTGHPRTKANRAAKAAA